MSFLDEIRGRLKVIALPASCAVAMTYFGYHAVMGEHGFLTMIQLEKDLHDISLRHDQMVSDRQLLEREVSLLKSRSLDPDMLDERARALLGFTDPDDLVIYLDK